MRGKISPGLLLANLVVIGLAMASCIGTYTVQPLYPLNNMATDDRTPVFEWSGRCQGCTLLIDDDPAFGTSMEFRITGNIHEIPQELEFGTYWWKIMSAESETRARRFTVLSTVALSRPVGNLIANTGNTEVFLRSSGLAGAVTLAVNQSIEIREDDHVRAEQK